MTIIFYNSHEKALVADKRITYNNILQYTDLGEKIRINNSNTIAYAQCGSIINDEDFLVLDILFQNWYYDQNSNTEKAIKEFFDNLDTNDEPFCILIMTRSKLFYIAHKKTNSYWFINEMDTNTDFGYGSGEGPYYVCMLAKVKESDKIIKYIHLSTTTVSREYDKVKRTHLKALPKTRKIHE